MADQRRSRVPGCMLIGSLAVAITGALVFLVFEYTSSAGRRKVKQRLSEISSQGYPVSAYDLHTYYELPEDVEDVTELWISAAKRLDELVQSDSVGVPLIGVEKDINQIPIDGSDWIELEATKRFLVKASPQIQKLHEAAARGGRARYPADLTKGYMTLLEHVQHVRNAARILQLEILIAARENDVDRVARSISTTFALGESLRDEPLIVSQLVRIAVDSMAHTMLWKTLPQVDFADRHYEQFRRDLRSSDFSEGLHHAYVGERAASLDILQNPRKFSEDEGLVDLRTIVGPRHADTLFYLDYSDEILAAAKRPFPEALTVSQGISDAFERRLSDSILDRYRYAVSAQIIPATQAIFVATARAYAIRNISEVAIAIRKYRDANGQLPKQLNRLVPDYLQAVPQDPYDGQSLRYRLMEAGETNIYSVGRDRKDDGGTFDEQESDAWQVAYDPDIVVRILWPEDGTDAN